MKKQTSAKEPIIRRRKLSEYLPDMSNANMGSERGLQMVEDSLSQDGVGRSIVADAGDRIPAGNKTLEAAMNAGIEDVIEIETDGRALIVHKRTDWDLTDPLGAARRYAYRDNRASELSLNWSSEQLLADINAGVDLSHLFTEYELDELLADLQTDAPADDPGGQVDRAEELQAKWHVERGQLWTIGDHRLLCGDSTNAEDVAQVMGGERAALLATDPPYNVSIDYGDNVDDNKATEEYEKFTRRWFGVWSDVSDNQIITPGCNNLALWLRWFDAYHVAPWTKTNAMTNGKVSRWWCWEPVLFFGVKWNRTRANDVFNFPVSAQQTTSGESLTKQHPCPKPLPMWVDIIESYTNQGDVIAEAFSGSGTTHVACEQTKRHCYGLELEPKYCAVILERMSGMGLEPRLSE